MIYSIIVVRSAQGEAKFPVFCEIKFAFCNGRVAFTFLSNERSWSEGR